MTRSILLALPLLFACKSEGDLTVQPHDTGLDADTGDLEDTGLPPEVYDEAFLRILSPASASYLPLGEPAHFEAEVFDQDGEPLPFDEVVWTSSADSYWSGQGVDFWDGDLDVGVHDLTAVARLPNDDRVAHTVGGVLVQSPWAGTYVGLFVSTVTYESVPVPCNGVATLVVEPYGARATGDATCVASLMGYEMEFNYAFELDNVEGQLSGRAAADIMGMFEYDFEASGTLDAQEMTFAFGDDVFGMLQLKAEVRTDRISDDSGL